MGVNLSMLMLDPPWTILYVSCCNSKYYCIDYLFNSYIVCSKLISVLTFETLFSQSTECVIGLKAALRLL